MTVNHPNSTLSSIVKVLQEEEVKYKTALRIKSQADIVKSIQQEIEQLKSELSQRQQPTSRTN